MSKSEKQDKKKIDKKEKLKKDSKGLIKEFKEFAVKGNVIDLAVGVVMGTAFGKIVSSLVDDIIMPLVSPLTGSVKFTDLKLSIHQGNFKLELPYGNFIQALVNFIIIAFAIFIFVKFINKFNKKKEEKEEEKKPELTAEEKLLIEIRDILKDKK